MSASPNVMPSKIDRIRHDLVGLKMARALDALDHVVRRSEEGEIATLKIFCRRNSRSARVFSTSRNRASAASSESPASIHIDRLTGYEAAGPE